MKEGISSRQAILLITICRIVSVLTIMSPIYMGPANQDIWIVVLTSFIYTILTTIPILFLSNKFNNLTIIQYMEKIFGKFVGKFVVIIYTIFYTRIAILFFYISIQMIRSSFMPDTKPIITTVVLMISCVYIASKGIDVIARFAEMFVPIILIMISIFIVLGYNNVDLSVLLPIYKDSTFLNINYGAIQLTFTFIDINILAMITPKLESKKEINSIFIKSVLYSLVFVLASVVATQGSLGVEQARHSNFPFLAYIRRIKAYSIFERIESIYIIMWILAMIIKITTYIYISNQGVKEIFKKKSGNMFLYIMGAIVALATFYIAEINPIIPEIMEIKSPEYVYYFAHKTLIPLIAVIVYLFRKKTFENQQKLGN